MRISILYIVFSILGFLLFFSHIPDTTYQIPHTTFGVTFSPMYTRYLGLDLQKTYLDILDNLKVKNLRIPTYWSLVEETPGQFNFKDTDFMVDEAQKKDAKLIMVVGIKQPRWPECHIPDWAKKLTAQERQQKALQYIHQVINRYQDRSNIIAWQVENEPFVAWFGEGCDVPDSNFLQQEADLVRGLDSSKPIIITETGEWSTWTKAAKVSDKLGVSLYRKAYHPKFGFITYPFPPFMYSLKAKLVGKEVFIAELQAEPWAKSGVRDTSLDEQLQLFSVSDLKNTTEYAKKTSLKEIYFWGVEWWYYMSENGHPEYLEYAKTLF